MKKTLQATVLATLTIISPPLFAKAQKQDNTINHPYTLVKISYATSELTNCSFQYSPINFCDAKHVEAYRDALKNNPPNFNDHYILLTYPEFKNYHQRTAVAIDTQTGVVYPLPIDAFSGYMHGRRTAKDDGKITYSLDGNKVCISGAILVYRAFEEGNFCFDFVGDKFIGHHTEYMYP
ncbi:hypothetical protein [Burkholderia sp. Cy-637]|uniref:hypothetical protein n=1 Tax=Burkholderia sp. Cy-637 TaxID=2608327 RepID=UPI0014247949|nr:hypothetical protein [Burkholderia sp. Cy-637]NIF87781.1 hypothetical protein [Burkholderia sp. Cy-637]